MTKRQQGSGVHLQTFHSGTDMCNVYAMYSAMYMQCIAMYSNVNEWL